MISSNSFLVIVLPDLQKDENMVFLTSSLPSNSKDPHFFYLSSNSVSFSGEVSLDSKSSFKLEELSVGAVVGIILLVATS